MRSSQPFGSRQQPGRRSDARSKRATSLAVRDSCQLLLKVSEHPLHYSAIARIIREQSPLRPTERQVLGALRVLESRGIVRRTTVGVYTSATAPSPAGPDRPHVVPAQSSGGAPSGAQFA